MTLAGSRPWCLLVISILALMRKILRILHIVRRPSLLRMYIDIVDLTLSHTPATVHHILMFIFRYIGILQWFVGGKKWVSSASALPLNSNSSSACQPHGISGHVGWLSSWNPVVVVSFPIKTAILGYLPAFLAQTNRKGIPTNQKCHLKKS